MHYIKIKFIQYEPDCKFNNNKLCTENTFTNQLIFTYNDIGQYTKRIYAQKINECLNNLING